MPKIKQIKEAYKRRSINKNRLIEVAKSNAITELLDVINVNYSVIDADGNYISQNNSMITDISQGEVNAQLIDPISWADCQKVMESHSRKVVEEQFDGRYYLSVKQPVLSGEECIGIIILSFDITERKQAELAKTEFLENMSHDLRTPFSGILSLTEYLYNKEEEPEKKELLGEIKNSGKRLLALLNQVLELARQGSYPIDLKDFSLLEVIQEVVDLVHAEAKHKGLTITVSCPALTVHSDRARFSRILLNLLGNAVKYTEKGVINIKVKETPLKIMIEDTGEGIPTDALETIFARFSKLRPSYKRQNYDGAGIGLHIAREYARELGGDITVTSEVGKGSCFTLLTKE